MDLSKENYQLKWHSFGSYLHGCIASAVNGDYFTDVSLVTMDGRQIQAHKFILSACSQYLHQVLKLQSRVVNRNLPLSIILPPEITYKTLKVLVQYMYSGETTVSQDILESVLRGGDLLKVRGLWRPNEETVTAGKPINIKWQQKLVRVNNNTTKNKQNGRQLQVATPPAAQNNGQAQSVIKEPKVAKQQQQSQQPPQEQSVIKTTQKSSADEPMKKSNEGDASKDLMQLLVIKEEPIEWSEVNQDDIEMVEREDIFDSELIIKPEVQMDEDDDEELRPGAENPEELYTPLTCELCAETFKVPADWVKHVQSHTDMMPAKRQKRGRSSADEDNKNFPPLQCDMCQEYFSTPAQWVHHVQNAHNEQQEAAGSAEKPSQRQHTSSSSIRSSTTYSENIEWVTTGGRKQLSLRKTCSVCNKGFPSHASMLIHKRTHTGERPYNCDFCSKGFNVKSNLLRHLRTLHDRYMNPTEVEVKENDEGAALP